MEMGVLNRDQTAVSIMFFVMLIITLYACKERYVPQINDNNINYLVVEGLINVGTDSTKFTLSRTFKLNGKPVVGAEKGAVVQVEAEGGDTYVLPELAKAGVYARPSLGLDVTKKYRLRIRTKDNREYLSEFVESRISPPIDKVRFELKDDNFTVYADTHDPSGNSKYYLYSGLETWQYKTDLTSLFKIENHTILSRNFPDDYIDNCWHTTPTSNISVGSTVNLGQDILADQRIISLPKRSSKLFIGYSILVKQTVLTRDGFRFWENLKNNTENVGSIFDAQPSQLFGNIHCTTNPAETVIGFVSAGTVTEKRLSVIAADLPAEWTFRPIDSVCYKSVRHINVGIPVQQLLTGPDNPSYIPIDEKYFDGQLIGYSATNMFNCVDCRLQGGTNRKPSYWR